jgi:hypothetical protein
MTDPVTDSVTRYERDTNTVRNAAPHHTTPHHTTKNTSSRSDALPRGREIETTHLSRLADIHPIDGLAKVVLTLRPDWTAKAVINWISNDDRPWVEVCRAALRADDRDIRQPAGLRYVGVDYDGKPTPLPPTVRELRTAPRCQHEAPSGLCALCRNGVE